MGRMQTGQESRQTRTGGAGRLEQGELELADSRDWARGSKRTGPGAGGLGHKQDGDWAGA